MTWSRGWMWVVGVVVVQLLVPSDAARKKGTAALVAEDSTACKTCKRIGIFFIKAGPAGCAREGSGFV